MVKLVDMPDLGSGAARRVGSSPIIRTKKASQSRSFFYKQYPKTGLHFHQPILHRNFIFDYLFLSIIDITGNYHYLLNIFNEMSVYEKEKIKDIIFEYNVFEDMMVKDLKPTAENILKNSNSKIVCLITKVDKKASIVIAVNKNNTDKFVTSFIDGLNQWNPEFK